MTSVPTLSYSSVRTYLECPLRWKFLYVDRLPEAPRGYFSFGRSVHATLEELIRPLVRPLPRVSRPGETQRTLDSWESELTVAASPLMTRQALLDAYAREWVSEGYGSKEEEERYRLLGREMLTSYYDAVAREPPTPVAVEPHLEAAWDGIPIHGYVDRIDLTRSGGLEILDYKTSRELSKDDARESDQLGLYQVLVERNFNRPVEALTLLHLRSLTPLTVPPKPATELETLYGRVGTARDGIRSDSFEPTPGRQCARCEFRARCPEFKEVPEPERDRLQQLVDRFAELRRAESTLEDDLRSAAEELHHAAEQLGIHRIPGSREVALRRREESWEFPVDSVRAFVERHGLSGRLRSSEPAAIRTLARDPSLDPGLRREIAALGARKVRWFWELESAEENP